VDKLGPFKKQKKKKKKGLKLEPFKKEKEKRKSHIDRTTIDHMIVPRSIT